jgi:hypothetical protein
VGFFVRVDETCWLPLGFRWASVPKEIKMAKKKNFCLAAEKTRVLEAIETAKSQIADQNTKVGEMIADFESGLPLFGEKFFSEVLKSAGLANFSDTGEIFSFFIPWGDRPHWDKSSWSRNAGWDRLVFLTNPELQQKFGSNPVVLGKRIARLQKNNGQRQLNAKIATFARELQPEMVKLSRMRKELRELRDKLRGLQQIRGGAFGSRS